MVRLIVCVALVLGGLTCSAQQPPQAAAPAAAPQQAPFALTPQDEAYLDQVLAAWEKQSAAVQNFRCNFDRWIFDAFSPSKEIPTSRAQGEVSYAQPDRGSFQTTALWAWTPEPRAPGDTGPMKGEFKKVENVIGEHWVCDGKNIYEFRHDRKELVETPIPPEMQGQRIVDGPLPFLFGAEAVKLKARYWMRVQTDPVLTNETQLTILAMPKYQIDAANYRAVEVILDKKLVLPKAIRVYNPDGSEHRYAFNLATAETNRQWGQLLGKLFAAPMTPMGYKRIVEQPGTAQPEQRQASNPAPAAK